MTQTASPAAQFASLEHTLEEVYTGEEVAVGADAASGTGNEFAAAVASTAPVQSSAPKKAPAQQASVARTAAASAAPAADGSVTNLKLDGFMKDRVASAEKESQQLRQLLHQADSYENGLWSNITKFKAAASHAIMKAKIEVRQVPRLKKRLKQLSARMKDEEGELTSKQRTILNLQGELYNASRVAERSNKALQWAQLHLNSLQRQNSGLLAMVRNQTLDNRELFHRLNASMQNRTALEKELQMVGTRLVKQNEKTKQAQKLAEDTKAEADRQVAAAHKRELDAEKLAASTSEKEQDDERIIHQLREELQRAQLHSEVSAGEKAELEWRRKDANTTKASAAKNKQMSAAVYVLEKKADMLRKRAEDEDTAKQAVEHTNRDLERSLERLKAENKQLRGSKPWLVGKLESDQKELDKANADRRKVTQERDALKAMLKTEEDKVNELEQSYADSIQVMGKSYEAYEKKQAGSEAMQAALPLASSSSDDSSTAADDAEDDRDAAAAFSDDSPNTPATSPRAYAASAPSNSDDDEEDDSGNWGV